MQIIAFHGVQLETVRGIIIPFFSPLPITSRKRFIPLASIQNVIINEGLRRWNVRYYLCIIKDTQKDLTLEIIFEVGRICFILHMTWLSSEPLCRISFRIFLCWKSSIIPSTTIYPKVYKPCYYNGIIHSIRVA